MLGNPSLANKLLIAGLAAVCFVAGYAVAQFTGGGSADKQVAKPNEATKIAASEDQQNSNTTTIVTYTEIDDVNVTIEYILPTESYNNEQDEQDGFFGSIKDKLIREGADVLIDSVDVAELVDLVARITGYDQAHIWEMQTPHNFAKELLDLNFQECSSQEESQDNANAAFQRTGEAVLFSLNPPNGYNAQETIADYSNSFDQANASRIYANFKLPAGYAYTDVLVKWCKEWPQQRNLIFGPHDIDPARNLNYVWYAARQVELGEYYVQVYSSEEQPQLIAKGKYTILPNQEN